MDDEPGAARRDGPDWARHSPHPFVELAPDGSILRANPAAETLAGGSLRALLPDDVESLVSTCLDSSEPLESVESVTGGRTLTWTLRPAPSGESVGAFGYDITSWKRSEASLRRKDDLLEAVGSAARAILEARGGEIPLDDVLARLGRATGVSRIYIFRNETSEEGELLASQVGEWTQPHVEPQIDNPGLQGVPYEASGMGRWARELAAGRTLAGTLDEFPPEEHELLRAQEILSLVVTPILPGQRFWGFMGFDDCDRARAWSRAELEILRAAADTVAAALLRKETRDALDESRQQLRHVQRMEAVGRLAGGIAHDFNNLLTGILSNAEMLLEDLEATGPARDEPEAIRQSALRASRLTRQLLTFSRRQAMRPTTVELPQAIRETEELSRRLIGENIHVDTEVDGTVPPVWADRVQVEQVLMNLVVNARDAMPDGGRLVLRVRQATERDSLTRHGLEEDGDYVLVGVADTGDGMDPAIQEKVFEPFFTTKASGTGMGLSIVYGIVTQIGGAVWIDSTPGVGTEVTVAFPVDADPTGHGPRADEPTTGEAEAPLGDETILVVEDDEAVRNVTTRILARAGYTVLDAATAEDGLETLRREARSVDLVLTDVGLPDRSGIDMAREIRRRYEQLPIVFMSGFPGQRGPGQPLVVEDAPLDFLAKPFTRGALLRRIRSQLDAGDPRGGSGED